MSLSGPSKQSRSRSETSHISFEDKQRKGRGHSDPDSNNRAATQGHERSPSPPQVPTFMTPATSSQGKKWTHDEYAMHARIMKFKDKVTPPSGTQASLALPSSEPLPARPLANQYTHSHGLRGRFRADMTLGVGRPMTTRSHSRTSATRSFSAHARRGHAAHRCHRPSRGSRTGKAKALTRAGDRGGRTSGVKYPRLGRRGHHTTAHAARASTTAHLRRVHARWPTTSLSSTRMRNTRAMHHTGVSPRRRCPVRSIQSIPVYKKS